jgi:hypothetical protein
MPRYYAAIHFHQDDLYDCGWGKTDFTVAIPDGMASGVYGIRLRCNDIEDIVPIYVLPRAGTATAPIVFLASTFTYQIYGNHQRASVDDAFRTRQAERRAYLWNADQHPEYGASTYNRHPDGSGICYSSLRRPLLTMLARIYYFFRHPRIGRAAFSCRYPSDRDHGRRTAHFDPSRSLSFAFGTALPARSGPIPPKLEPPQSS